MEPIKDREFVIETETITVSGNISSNCNAITFINTGAVNVYIKKILLAPGLNMVIAGNQNEIDKTVYDLNFGSVTTGSVAVIRKINL